MKKIIFRAAALAGVLLSASCTMFNTSTEHYDDAQKAYIKITVNGTGAKTALPYVERLYDFDSFVLTGKTNGKTEINEVFKESTVAYNGGKIELPVSGGKIPIGVSSSNPKEAIGVLDPGEVIIKPPYPVETVSAYENMCESNIAVTVGKTYEFTLSAIKGGAVWQGTASETISTGTNTLNFVLKLFSIGSTDSSNIGSLYVELEVPSIVKSTSVNLYNMDGSIPDWDEYAGYDYYDTLYTNLYQNWSSYGNYVPVGNYVLVFDLYADEEKTLKLGTWREYAGVAAEVESWSSPSIKSEDELESIYSINISANGGTLAGTAAGSYTRYSSDILLPTAEAITKNAFVFKGWNQTTEEGAVIVSKPQITAVKAGSVGDIYVSAEWAESGIHANESGTNFHISRDNNAGTAQITAW